ncbi:MAG: hypothetical protein ACFFKA_11805, partial [Candidatus Thorarchaeota archaeon]
ENLSRLNFIFKNQSINTECIENCNQFSILGEIFGPFEKGKKYKLKLFEVLLFIKHRILKLTEEEKCDNVDVQRYAISERDDPKLILRENVWVLNRVKEFKFFIENEVKESIKPKVDLDRYLSYFVNIIDSRLLKLLRLARSELSLEDEKRLTSSEKILYQKLFNLISEWRTFFLKA